MRWPLGAERRHIVRLIVRQSLGLVALGGLIGLALGLSAARSLDAFIPGTYQLDARTFAASLLTFLAVGLAAAFLPALRAARTDRSLSRRLC